MKVIVLLMRLGNSLKFLGLGLQDEANRCFVADFSRGYSRN